MVTYVLILALSLYVIRFESYHLTYLCRSWSHATSLSLQSCVRLCDQAVVMMSTHIGHLTIIDVSGCRDLTDTAVMALARASGDNLKTFKMNGNKNITMLVRSG